jgi:hypothetical protein
MEWHWQQYSAFYAASGPMFAGFGLCHRVTLGSSELGIIMGQRAILLTTTSA